MTALTTSMRSLRSYFLQTSGLRLILYLNLLLFALVAIGQFVLDLVGSHGLSLWRLGALYPSGYMFLSQPWGLLTYSWLHDGLWHLATNMLLLYLVDEYLARRSEQRRLVALYVLSGLWGGIVLVLVYLVASALGAYPLAHPVFGSSGAVIALLGAIAVAEPHREIRLAFVGNIRLRDLLLAFIVLDIGLMLLFDGNIGGHILHLSGIFLGVCYTLLLRRYQFDLVAPLLSLWDRILRRQAPAGASPMPQKLRINQAEVDRVLDKMKSSGYSTLNARERDTLSRASEELQNKE